jgi:chromosome segregation protein
MLARALDELTGSSGRQAIAEIEGVVGSLVDLLVVDAGWEKAVESAAGAAVAAVVVDGRTAAHAALERLRREGASGLVLAAATGTAPSVDGLPAGVEMVRSHVSVRPGAPASLSGVLDQLFGRAVRVGSLDSAIDLALDRPDLVVVTEEGDRFSTTGWRVTAGTGGVVTAQAVADAEAEAEMAVLAAGTAVQLRAEARAAAVDAAERRSTSQRDLDRAVAAVATERAAEVGVLEQATRLDEEIAEVRRSLEEAEAALAAEAADLEALNATLPELEETAARAEERASWAEQARTTLEAHRAHVVEMRQVLEVRTAELTERRRALTDRLGQVERRLAGHVEARLQAAERRQRLEGDAVAIERLGVAVAGITERSEALLDRRREAYASEVQAVRASNERLEQLRRDRAAADAGLSSHIASIRALEIESAEVAVKLEAVIEMIRRDLGTEPAATVGAPAPELPEGVTAAERAAALDAEVEKLGPINPLALEELSALEERHEDLDTQVSDVRSARRELQEVVRALDEEIMSTFAAAAADVNEHFSALVAMLFPGGQGRLILTDPDDLLHTGVEVEVRPLGRNVRRISLLSGGEQSMAALAFLFAVFRSRPSPFYLMDEVEAALDDVNLHRFLGLLREFRDEAQLIVVSHQKRTMETGDALYGVTMKPGGSSQVVSQKVPTRAEDPAEAASA